MSSVASTSRGVTTPSLKELPPNRQVAKIMGELLQKKDKGNGFFYPDEYYYKLDGFTKRRDWLQQRGDFFHGYLPHKLFIHTNRPDLGSPTGKITEFQIRKDVLPSDAMDAVLKQLALVDCSNMCQIAQYQAIRKTIGDEKFNLLFKGRLLIGDYMNKSHPLNPFLLPCHEGSHPTVKKIKSAGLTITDPLLSKRDIRNEPHHIPVGARVFFQNVDRYPSKHLVGHAASFNVIYAGGNRYYAFGISSEPVTADRIVEALITAFNSRATEGKHLNTHAKMWYDTNRCRFSSYEMDTIKDFGKEGGGLEPLSGKMLNEKLLQLIAEMDVGDLSWEWVLTSCLSTHEDG